MYIYKSTTPRKTVTGKAQRHHVGMFYWSSYWHRWDIVRAVDVMKSNVTVVEVDQMGVPVLGAMIRKHYTSMDMAMFSDRPFPVTRD